MRLRRAARLRQSVEATSRPGLEDRGRTFDTTVEDWVRQIVDEARPYTMTSPERVVSVIDATLHVAARGVPGALVECGVWRGGSILAMIRTLQHTGVDDRDIFLYDTFQGMTAPGPMDTSRFDGSAREAWETAHARGRRPWQHLFRPSVFNLDDLRALLENTGYPERHLHYVEGPVEATLPGGAPPKIALLRLDTDWYDSTRHELVHLYPSLAVGGVLIIDDYGHWEGCRRAVDEYFDANGGAPLLHRIDYTGRMAIKT